MLRSLDHGWWGLVQVAGKGGKKSGQHVTLRDVAAAAGVGKATVDRVINDRGNVSDEVRNRVLQIARDLGLRRILPSGHRRNIRINVVLGRPDRPLIVRLAEEFRRRSARLDAGITVHRTILRSEDPGPLATAMLQGAFDAVIICAPDDPQIHAATAILAERAIPVVTVISDVPRSARLAYAGTDHYKAGRSAGFFLGRMTSGRAPGKVIVLCYHTGLQAQSERIRGLKDHLAVKVPHLTLAEIVMGGDDPILSEVKLVDAFRRHPETICVYNVGAGNRGVVAAIQRDILSQRPIFVGHELTNFTWHALREGLMTLAIDQSPTHQADYAIEVLLNHFGFDGATHAVPPYVSDAPIVLYGPENLPDSPPA